MYENKLAMLSSEVERLNFKNEKLNSNLKDKDQALVDLNN